MEQDRPVSEDQPTDSAEGPIDTVSLLRWCITVLAANAWQGMGLVPNPTTNKIERKLDDARLAIDAAAALMDQVKPRLGDSERRQLEALLTDLRMNFLQQKDGA